VPEGAWRPAPARAARCVALLLAVCVAAACGDGGGDDPTSFALIGDSLVVRISCPGAEVSDDCLRSRVEEPDGPLTEAMGHAYDVRVDAEGGRRFRQMLDRAQALADESPDVMAENLGTNDSIVGNTGWVTPFDVLLSIMLERPCVVLTTVSLETESRDPSDNRIATKITAAVAKAAAAHPQVRVVDWAAAVSEHGGELSEDGFHPTTQAGRDWLAQAYRDAADSCPD
jgi:hypothetical protein